ncbi:MAG: hypothetical protein WAN43_11765 [Rhodomicrobium sp.]
MIAGRETIGVTLPPAEADALLDWTEGTIAVPGKPTPMLRERAP